MGTATSVTPGYCYSQQGKTVEWGRSMPPEHPPNFTVLPTTAGGSNAASTPGGLAPIQMSSPDCLDCSQA